MLLESLKPDSVHTVCERIAAELALVENELAQYEQALASNLDPSQRSPLERLSARRARKATLLRAHLTDLRAARYSDDHLIVSGRLLQIA